MTINELLNEIDEFLSKNNIRTNKDFDKWIEKNKDEISDEKLGLYKYVICVIEKAQEYAKGELMVMMVIGFLSEVGIPSKELQRDIGDKAKRGLLADCNMFV